MRALLAEAGLADSAGATPEAVGFPGGAAARHDDRAFVLLDAPRGRGLGKAIAWADQQGAGEVHLLTEDHAGVFARQARYFRLPATVWQVDGRSVERAEPEPLRPPAAPPEAALDLVGLLAAEGVDIVIEHGEVRGEILGLEIARIVVDGADARIEVGVGRHDREAFALVHGDLPTTDALRSVVDSVRRQRRPDDLGHPLARLAAERWLRAALITEPHRVGARSLEPVEPTVPRESIKDTAAAVAVGVDLDGHPIVVACSVGIDLDLVPAAADARAAHAPGARLVLALPERDAHPVTRRLAGALHEPAELVEVIGDWRA
ncbi:hypothetical protein [Rhabdothermincola sediminis]|uniref:hypothetical protein n=1 Tax=Rhabdothermincola sediminis TaxID=2751370 RepID=UPI001AA04879|nr:hypothetical protein [Rhabdothermincola sediminis]